MFLASLFHIQSLVAFLLIKFSFIFQISSNFLKKPLDHSFSYLVACSLALIAESKATIQTLKHQKKQLCLLLLLKGDTKYKITQSKTCKR